MSKDAATGLLDRLAAELTAAKDRAEKHQHGDPRQAWFDFGVVYGLEVAITHAMRLRAAQEQE